MRVPEVPGVGDDFLTLVNPHSGCRWVWCQVLVRHSSASQPALDGAREMATLCVSEHRLRPMEQFFLLMFPVKFLFTVHMVSRPRHLSSRVWLL